MRFTTRSSSSPRKKYMDRTNRSQGIVEFAVALPILLMLLFGIIDFSLLFSAWLLIQNMSRQAVRYAVTGNFDTAYCPGPAHDCKDPDPAVQAGLVDAARLPSIRDTAYQFQTGLLIDQIHKDDGAFSTPGFIQVTVCSGRRVGGVPYVTTFGLTGSGTYSDCTFSGVSKQDPGGAGDEVIVLVDFNHPYLTPFLNQVWPFVHLASAQEGVIEKFRVARLITTPNAITVPTPSANRPTIFLQRPSAIPVIPVSSPLRRG